MIITIDGPSGTGKSTVAKGVAKKLNFTFFDTGAMYRSVAWMLHKAGIDPSDSEKVKELLPNFKFEIQSVENGGKRYFVCGEDATEAIRSQQISFIASQIAAYPDVRTAMVKIQRKFGARSNAVFEGRDMGTVVFPKADLKIFLTARPGIRAERRYRELLEKFPDLAQSLTLEQIWKEIEERDQNDSTRAISPLKQAPDAILIDTSDLTIQEVIEKIVALKPSKGKIRFPRMKFPYWFVYSLVRIFFKIFFRHRIYGLEHFRHGSAILAANHASLYDPPLLSTSCPEEVHFLAKASLFEIPFLGRLIRVLNSHPITRGASDANTFRTMIDILEKGKKLILFPEGKRSEDGQLRPFERGMAFLAYKARCGIIPAYLQGTFETWPPDRKFPKISGKTACVFGSPIEWEEFEGMDKKEAQDKITERAEQAIRSLKEWLDAGAKGTPP